MKEDVEATFKQTVKVRGHAEQPICGRIERAKNQRRVTQGER